MQRIALILLLTFLGGNALAEWMDVGGDNASTVFVDPSSIRKAGNYEEMLSLFDTDDAEVIGDISFLSSKSLDEFDCEKERSRTLAFYWYSENMGKGKVLYTNSTPGEWRDDLPNSLNGTLWMIACGKQAQR